jgi:hypothetical protein
MVLVRTRTIPPYSTDMSPCDYDLFYKMKEPLRGTCYNTREEIIRAVGQSLLDINRSGRADGVRRLPQIWHFRTVEVLPLLFIRPLYLLLTGLQRPLDIDYTFP